MAINSEVTAAECTLGKESADWCRLKRGLEASPYTQQK